MTVTLPADRRSFVLSSLLSFLILGLSAAAGAPSEGGDVTTDNSPAAAAFRPYAHPVMTWVPPYSAGKAKDRLVNTPGMIDALSHVGLQFWSPTKDGGVTYAPFPEANDDTVKQLRDFAHQHGVRVLLCVYNAPTRHWDWALAKAGFAEHRQKFVNALLSEVDRLKLDGVDVDLEGDGNYPPEEKTPFLAFITDLSAALHARDEHLTVDTFAYEWHAPNQTWWAELFPLVDGLTTMGYEEIGRTATPASEPWRAYSAQRDAAGENKAKLMLGLPAGRDHWRGNTLAEQLDWIKSDGTTGLSFWDAQIPDKAWQDARTWKTIQEIRGIR